MDDAPLELLLKEARVVTMDGPNGAPPAARLAIVERGAVGIAGGVIRYVGPADTAPNAQRVIDCKGRVLMPGLIDPHTHLVFAGSRVDEFARRMAGEDYRVIAAEGGGIRSTVRASRAASDEELFVKTAARARALARHGVARVEIKSGYGLTFDDELRHLRVARRVDSEGLLSVTTSLLAAHAVPPEYEHDRDGWVREIAERIVPAAASSGLADACDVYLDDGAFTLAEARTILTAARAHGLTVRAHVGQFRDLDGASLVAELGGRSADHLEHVSDDGLLAMARAGVVAVWLPGAWRTLRQAAPDAARFRSLGVRIAVGTDCNPGTSPSVDLPLMASLAVRDAGLTLEEALLAITVEAAAAAGFADGGRIVRGAPAHLALYDEEDPRALPYALGGLTARLTLVNGKVVHEGHPSEVALW